MQYRKKPKVIEAWRIGSDEPHPEWLVAAQQPGKPGGRVIFNTTAKVATILTPEGRMSAVEGDWIIKGIEGELYSCRDSIFQETYEKVE